MITRDVCRKYSKQDLSYTDRLIFLNMKTLENRRKIQTLKFIFRIIHNFPEIPTNLTDQITIYNDPTNGHSILRRENKIQLSNKYLILNSVNLFNDLPKKYKR